MMAKIGYHRRNDNSVHEIYRADPWRATLEAAGYLNLQDDIDHIWVRDYCGNVVWEHRVGSPEVVT